MDPLSIVADEVALEGLDGITIPTLWIRLESRKPEFPLKLDDCTKGFIWRSLVNNTELRFYKLPQEREDIELFDRFKSIDPETGIEMTETLCKFKDIYPVHIIPENKDGIQGSCPFFKERKDVTKQIRTKSLTPSLSLEQALKIYGRKLVVVASQSLRFRALIGTQSDPDIKLSSDSYCVLERVGRARWQGELQRDLHGGLFNADARKFHYIRKSVVKHELVSTQSYVRRLKTGQQQHTILLLLKRFHVNRRSRYDILMECASNFLQQSPDQFATVDMLKEHLIANDGSFKRLLNYMRSAKLIEFCHYPLEDLDPSAGPCTNKNGTKVLVRCVKLLKPYIKKGAAEDEDDEDDEDEEDYTGPRRGEAVTSLGRIMERDIISQAYDIILSSGTKGVTQRDISVRMNIGALESRMIWRKLLRDGVIKGFMEDVGRQRVTKYISLKYVGVSDKLQQFAKERERNNQLCSSTPLTLDTEPGSPKTLTTSTLPANTSSKTASARKKGRGGKKAAEEQQVCGDSRDDAGVKSSGGKKSKTRGRSVRKTSEEEDAETAEQRQPDVPITQSTQPECETTTCTGSVTGVTPESESIPAPDKTPAEEQEQSRCMPQSEAVNEADNSANNKIVVVDSAFQPQRSHETYRLLKRKNLIVEAVNSSKIIEGFFSLQKIISDEEKQDGVSTKCCKKTISRLVHSLSREGLLKIYTTTVIQDGITKKIDMIAHPSIQPNDDRVAQLLDQIRFKISSSSSAMRLQQAEAKAREQQKASENPTTPKKSNAGKKMSGKEEEVNFCPKPVSGLGKKMGFQPKMHRLRVIHNVLWYLIYGHPLRNSSTESESANQASEDPNGSNTDPKLLDCQANQDLEETRTTDVSKGDEASGDEDELLGDKSEPGHSESEMKVYVDEESWRRFVPPVRVHKELTSGWAMVGDLLLCFPLSIFMQFIQINYKVDGLDEYLNDPIKQHYLVRALPARTKRQLLYKRKYIHVFHENLQKLIYMGLLQIAPAMKFKEKEQLCVYLKRNATIVDTTSSEPHYWLVTEPPDKPFERRHYTFNTAEDVEGYWFDMLCVCLNTPLGVIRSKRNTTEEDSAPSFVPERNMFAGLAYLLKGSYEVCDDGSIPGDGKGAAGLDSKFFAHLKRNWFWTNHLLASQTTPSGGEAPQTKSRLKSLLSRHALRIAVQAGESSLTHYLTNKQSLATERVKVSIEPASRNQHVVGGKGHKRKRVRKEAVKVQRKKRKEPKKRTAAHDEADHKALKMMTKQRVHWSVQEDSVIMLCSVAAHLLNSKLKKSFVPHCVVRDLLHAELVMSVDKTSVAVGRRARYILKNPQTHLNFRICLAEVYQDKALLKQLEEIKPADPDKADDCAIAFSEYVRLLRKKFSCVSTQDVIIPDSKQELFSRFKVSAIDDGKQVQLKDTLNSTDDIYAIVLHNLIQSTLAMTNGQMKTSRSFQTFHTYSQYDQELLCRVFIQTRKKRLVNRRRIGPSFGPKKNRGLPILPMSFQLSQSYYRRFLWRFPQSLCTDAFCFLRSLISNGSGDEKPIATFYHETENRSQNGEEVLERKAESSRKEKQKGVNNDGQENEPQKLTRAANTEIRKEDHDDQNKMQEEEKSDVHNEKTEEKSTSDEQNPSESSMISASEEASSSRKQADDHLPKESSGGSDVLVSAAGVSEDPPDMSDMLRFSLSSPGGSCALSLSLMSLGLLSVFVSIPKQIVMVDSNLVDNDVAKSMAALEDDDDDDDDDEDGAACEGKKRLQVTSHQASHTNYLLMKGYCCPGIVKLRNLSINDNIVVESCIVRLKLRDTPAHHVFIDEGCPPLVLTKYGPSLLPSILTSNIRSPSSCPPSVEECDSLFIQERGYTDQDIEACAQLRRSLDEAGENGLDASDLRRAHVHLQEPQSGRTRGLQEYLKDLQEGGQVVRVGSVGIRWVLLQHAEPWLLTVNCKPQTRSQLTSEKRPLLKSQHNIPFLRKRCSREPNHETEEPPAKKLAVDKGKVSDPENVDGSLNNVTDKPAEEEAPKEQKETSDDGGRDTSLSIEEKAVKTHPEDERKKDDRGEDASPTLEEEEKVQTHPEEDDGQEKMETEQKQDRKRRTRRSSLDERKEETSNLPTGSADEENVRFISRPWRFIDGKLNRSVCKGMLEAVLYHIMSQPGLTQTALLDHYKDSLQPMVVLDLVEALLELGCVTKKTVVKDPKPSLFARSAHQRKSRTTSEEADTVFYEPTISCCLRLCRVLPNERRWNDIVP